MRGKFLSLLLAVAALGLPTGSVRAGDYEKIWSGIIFGSNQPSEPLPPPLDRCLPKFRRLFGFQHFKLLGQNTQTVRSGTESWLVPSKEFFLKVGNLEPLDGGYRMTLTLFQNRRQLLEADVKLARESPLVIRGPSWGRGTVIIVLACK